MGSNLWEPTHHHGPLRATGAPGFPKQGLGLPAAASKIGISAFARVSHLYSGSQPACVVRGASSSQSHSQPLTLKGYNSGARSQPQSDKFGTLSRSDNTRLHHKQKPTVCRGCQPFRGASFVDSDLLGCPFRDCARPSWCRPELSRVLDPFQSHPAGCPRGC